MREGRRALEDRRGVPQAEIEHAPLPVAADVRQRIVLAFLAYRQGVVCRDTGFLYVDAEQDVHVFPQVRFLELKNLVGQLESLALEGCVDGALRIVHFHKEALFGQPGVAAVIRAAEHFAECRPDVVLRGLVEGGGASGVEREQAFTAVDEVEQRLLQLRVVPQHALRVVETDGVKLFELRGPKHLYVVAEDNFESAGALAHLFDRVSAEGNGSVPDMVFVPRLHRLVTKMRRAFWVWRAP